MIGVSFSNSVLRPERASVDVESVHCHSTGTLSYGLESFEYNCGQSRHQIGAADVNLAMAALLFSGERQARALCRVKAGRRRCRNTPARVALPLGRVVNYY